MSQVVANMLQNRIRIVDIRRRHGRVRRPFGWRRELGNPLLVRSIRGRKGVRRHVEATQREVDHGVDFAGDAAVVVVAEALEVHDEVLRQSGEGDLLGGFAGDFAVGAFPALFAAQAFVAAELGETLVEGGGAGMGDFDADAGEELPGCADEVAGFAAEARHGLAAEEVVDGGKLAVGVALPLAFGCEILGESFAELFLFGSEILEDGAVEVGIEIFV